MEHFEAIPSRFKSETLRGKDLLPEFYDLEAHAAKPRFAHRSKGGAFHYSPLDSELTNPDVVFSVVRDGTEIVGLAKLRKSPHAENVLWLMSISVDTERQGEKISEKILREVFSYAKERGMSIEPSNYTKEGEERIKHQIERLSTEYGVTIV
jgi:isocitrate/isopropylmalate dehydrogenase